MANERVTRRTLVLAKVEGTYGTDPTPTAAANALLISAAGGIPMDKDVATVDEDVLRESLSPGKILIGRILNRIVIQCHLCGSGDGTANKPPYWDPLIKGCGFTRTDTADATHRTYAYTLISTGAPGVTFYVYMDGVLYKAHGGRGSMRLNMEAGKKPKLTFDFDATFVAPIEAALPSATMPPNLTTMVESEGLTFGTFGDAQGLCPVSLDVEIGIDRRERPNMNKPFGFGGIGIRGRKQSGMLKCEAIDDLDGAGVVNWDAYLRAQQTLPDASMHDITLTHKSAAVDPQTQIKPTIKAPQILDARPTDMDGGTYMEIPFRVRNDTAEAEFKLEVIEKIAP